MLYRLKRHPIPIRAFFRHCMVLTYALPREALEPLLPPGLRLDTRGDLGFLAIAMVQTEGLRPVFLPPALGQDFFLSGYRVFARFRTAAGKDLRGLRILRSDTDRWPMAIGGNLLTHYAYRKAAVRWVADSKMLNVRIRTPGAEADLHVIADLASKPAPLPEGSPFATLREARRYAGPLPFTFDYEPETHSIIQIQGVRQEWDPQPIGVRVLQNTFLDQTPFRDTRPVLASAFHLDGVPYLWRRGRREALPGAAR